MGYELFPYLRKDLLDLILQTPAITGYNNFCCVHNSYYEIRTNNKFLYITFTETGLYIIIETPESRMIPSRSLYHENHYRFQYTDRIWLKDSLDSEELGNNTKLLSLVDTPEFKAKYGFSFYSLADRFKFLR
ncbi:MAG: hypothetical protein J6J60_05030 [Clostridia bacterium]|nr:hypothetical protein [Clostridia bacterium]